MLGEVCGSWVWWLMPGILAFERPKHKDLQERSAWATQ